MIDFDLIDCLILSFLGKGSLVNLRIDLQLAVLKCYNISINRTENNISLKYLITMQSESVTKTKN